MHMPAAQFPDATSIGTFCALSVKYRAFAEISCNSRKPANQPSATAAFSAALRASSLAKRVVARRASTTRWIRCCSTFSKALFIEPLLVGSASATCPK